MVEMIVQTQTLDELNLITRKRLIEVAGEVFAEFGFRGATVREICRRAGANVAAVNYHFRDKDGLYLACLTHFRAEAMRQYPPDMGVTESSTPAQRLHAFIRSYLFRILDTGRHALYGKLIVRNMVEPTAALDQCVEQSVRPTVKILHEIIRKIVGPDLSDADITAAGLSIVGQIAFYRNAKPVIEKLFPSISYSREELDALANHITEFSLAGLAAMKKRKKFN